MQYSGRAREQPLFVTLSTAHHDHSTLGHELYLESKRLLSGEVIDPHTHAVVYEPPEGSDWTQETTWRAACPSLGSTVSIDEYADECQRAKNNPRLEYDFRVYCLNDWNAGHAARWIPSNVYLDCEDKTLQESDYHGQRAIIGLDFAHKFDLCSYCILIQDGEKLVAFPRFFLPEQCVPRHTKDSSQPYAQYNRDGYIQFTSGDMTDEDELLAALLDDAKRFKIRALCYDVTDFELIAQRLRKEHKWKTVPVIPSYKELSPATHHLERLMHERAIRFPPNPILKWNFANAITKANKNDIIVAKDSDAAKIDGVSALVHGLVGVLKEPARPAQFGAM